MLVVAASSRVSIDRLTGILCDAGYSVKVTPAADIATRPLPEMQLVLLVSSACTSQLETICKLCRQIRINTPKLPIIIVGPNNADTKVRLFELGADDYIVEPFDHRELFARIQSLIRRRQFERAPSNPISES